VISPRNDYDRMDRAHASDEEKLIRNKNDRSNRATDLEHDPCSLITVKRPNPISRTFVKSTTLLERTSNLPRTGEL